MVVEPGIAPQRTTDAPPRSTGELLRGLFRLSKLFVYQHYYGWGMAWLLVTPQARERPGTTLAMLLFLVGTMGVVTCTCSLDDLVGFRNGSDARNYNSGETKRNFSMKPLLSGRVTEREAVGFVSAAATVAILAGLGAFWALDWQAPLESYVLYGVMLCCIQYSGGMRLSYYPGGGEAALFLGTMSGLLAPFTAAQHEWSADAVLVAALLGLWLVMVSSYSNVNDVEGDRSVNRRTLAATAPKQVYKSAMVAFFVLSAGSTCLLAATERWPWWTLLTLLPALGLHLRQLREGPLREEWLTARRLGLYAFDLGFVGLLVPTLLVVL
ncbi:UbiA family prenyltransferase [Streptomyces sp. B22F1]|uniref:UbiA family prenyltransferase n=1 Tax=Streptomyces sp. B22F1 TaxID=3153566 RepID=UPI00325DE7C9